MQMSPQAPVDSSRRIRNAMFTDDWMEALSMYTVAILSDLDGAKNERERANTF